MTPKSSLSLDIRHRFKYGLIHLSYVFSLFFCCSSIGNGVVMLYADSKPPKILYLALEDFCWGTFASSSLKPAYTFR